MEVQPLSCRLIEELWRTFDGVRTVGELLDQINTSFDGAIQEDDAILDIQELNDIGVIELFAD
jgi:hypothetical protein